jgi:hypothetical protein
MVLLALVPPPLPPPLLPAHAQTQRRARLPCCPCRRRRSWHAQTHLCRRRRCRFVNPVQEYVSSSEGQWVFWASWALALVMIIALSCSTRLRRRHPYNLIALFVFTAVMSVLVGAVCAYGNVQVRGGLPCLWQRCHNMLRYQCGAGLLAAIACLF